LGILAAENVLGLVPKGTHTWEKFVKPEELVRILEKSRRLFMFQNESSDILTRVF
jgi:2-polyprenyl-3-methyl-5-hydroxy-6-metoxy-1,4-benzoquinol methylase